MNDGEGELKKRIREKTFDPHWRAECYMPAVFEVLDEAKQEFYRVRDFWKAQGFQSAALDTVIKKWFGEK